jgi:hypothetical protein
MRRPFHVLDGLILVAAAGLAVVPVRDSLMEWPLLLSPTGWPTILLIWRDREEVLDFFGWIRDFLPALWVWTCASLVVRLRRPRPPIPAALQQPGASACLSVLCVSVLNLLYETFSNLVSWIFDPGLAGVFLMPEFLDDWELCKYLGFAVATVWIHLALTGRWQAEPSWTDRMGRLCGVLRLLMTPVSILNDLLVSRRGS